MKKHTLLLILFILYFHNCYSQYNFRHIEHGFKFKTNLTDQLGINLNNSDFNFNSKRSIGYEFGYIIRSKGGVFFESGFSYVINNLKNDVLLKDPLPELSTKNTFYDNYYIYNKLPLNLGVRFKLRNLPLHVKMGVNFLFLKPFNIKNIVSVRDNNNLLNVYFNSDYNLNPKSDILKTKSLSIGYEHEIFKKFKLVSELTLEYSNFILGNSVVNVFPNDVRNFIYNSNIKNKLNIGIDLAIIF